MRALMLTGAVAVVALAGACSQPADHVDGLAQPVNDAPVSAPSSAPPTKPTTKPATSAPTTMPAPATTKASPAATKRATDPCPASAKTLYAALRKSEMFSRAGSPDGMGKSACEQGFAFGRSTFEQEPQGEIAWVLFKFDTKAGAWRALNLGTAEVCDDYVPQPVQDRFNRSIGGGC
jgi:hypothetical protein